MRKTVLALVLALADPAFAVVPSTASRIDQTGNGATTAFTFTFPVTTSSSHVEVFLAGVKQTSGYTVALNANQSSSPGGTVTFTTAPANAVAVRIQRTVPLDQQTVYTPYSAFPAKTTEKALDRGVHQAQQVDRRVADAEATHAADLVTQDARDDDQDVALAQGAVGGNDTFITATASPTARKLKDRAADVINVKDFGAAGDGVTDDVAAITAADAVAGSSFATVYFPAGTYIIGSEWSPRSNRLYRGDATLKRKASTNIRVWFGNGISDATFEGLVFDGNKANQAALSGSTAAGVQCSNCTDLTIRGCRVVNFARYPMEISTGTRVRVVDSYFDGGEGASGVSSATLIFDTAGASTTDGVVVANNMFERTETSWAPMVQFRGNANGSKSAQHISFEGNRVKLPFAVAAINALGVEFGSGAAYFAATGNTLSGGSMGFSIAGSDSGTISGNHLDIGDATNATAFGADHKGIELTSANDVTVSGNLINGRGALVQGIRANATNARLALVGNEVMNLGAHAQTTCIEFGNSSYGTITDNVCDGNANAYYGVRVFTANHVLVGSNVLRNLKSGASIYGVSAATVDGLAISGNEIPSAPETAIYVLNSSGWTISGNVVRNGTTYGIFAQATGGQTDGTITGNTISGTGMTLGVLLKDYKRVAVTGNTVSLTAGGSNGIVLQGTAAASTDHLTIRGNRVVVVGTRVYFNSAIANFGPNIDTQRVEGMSADRGDASVTLVADTDTQTQRWATALTANRTVTLSTTGVVAGDVFRVVRTGLGAFTLDVGGLKTIPSATAAFVDVAYDGGAWVLTGYGAL
jgi:parallel beta-helix repeat protein